jgi:N-methylhydantoinase B
MATTNIADRLVCMTEAAFAQIGDGFGLAEGAMGMMPYMAVVSGEDSRLDNAPYVNQIFLGGSGGPGSAYADGWPTYILPVCAALLYHDSTEVDEQKYPFHVFEKRLIPDSEGAGRQRGGLGTRAVYGPKDLPMTVAYTVEGHFNPPQGVLGGQTGARGDAWKLDRNDERAEVPSQAAIELRPGEKIVSISCGGGGYGAPTDRDPELVLEDVAEGLISRERAESVYGVVLCGGSETGDLAVDEQATAAKRDELPSSAA